MGMDESYALARALELATANLANTTTWVEPEKVTEFIEKVAKCMRDTELSSK